MTESRQDERELPAADGSAANFFARPLLIVAVLIDVAAFLVGGNALIVIGAIATGLSLAAVVGGHMLERRQAQRARGIVCG